MSIATEISYDDVLKAALRLSVEDKKRLIYELKYGTLAEPYVEEAPQTEDSGVAPNGGA